MSPLDRRRLLLWGAALSAGIVVEGTMTGCGGTDRGSDDGGSDPTGVAIDAFLAGYPLVTTVRTMQTFGQLIGVNRLFVTPRLVDPRSQLVVAPNRDTVYVLAVLDLRAGPQVLDLPDIADRYHVVHILDAWMGTVGLLGTRTTGGRAGSFAVLPDDHGDPLPADVEPLVCPTPQAFVIGRIRAVDDTDAQAAAEIGRQIRLRPLTPPTGSEPPEAPSMPAPAGPPQTVGDDGIGFFDELGDALAVNPPVSDEQQAALDAAARFGIGPGEHPAVDPDGPHAELLGRAVRRGLAAIDEPDAVAVREIDGWAVNLDLGRADTDSGLRERAVIARHFWGPVPAEEAVYPRAIAADDGEPLDGANRYRIRFGPDGLPPVDAFWSLTVYGPDMFLVPNDANRWSLSGDTPGLVTDADGNLDIWLQHDPPAGHEANWLPVPDGRFELIMRLYLPRRPIVDGTYRYPPIEVRR
jgi:hypothetical protein